MSSFANSRPLVMASYSPLLDAPDRRLHVFGDVGEDVRLIQSRKRAIDHFAAHRVIDRHVRRWRRALHRRR